MKFMRPENDLAPAQVPPVVARERALRQRAAAAGFPFPFMKPNEPCEHGYLMARDCGACIQVLYCEAVGALQETNVALQDARATSRELNRRWQKTEARCNALLARVNALYDDSQVLLTKALAQKGFAESHAKGLELELKALKTCDCGKPLSPGKCRVCDNDD